MHALTANEGLFCDILWSDPSQQRGWNPSSRGISQVYGVDVSEQFLVDNSLRHLVRGHESVMTVSLVSRSHAGLHDAPQEQGDHCVFRSKLLRLRRERRRGRRSRRTGLSLFVLLRLLSHLVTSLLVLSLPCVFVCRVVILMDYNRNDCGIGMIGTNVIMAVLL